MLDYRVIQDDSILFLPRDGMIQKESHTDTASTFSKTLRIMSRIGDSLCNATKSLVQRLSYFIQLINAQMS